MKSIARIDRRASYRNAAGKTRYKQTRGWYVQVRWEGKTYTRFFSDSKYGNDAKALKAAAGWRDQIEGSIGKPRTKDHAFSERRLGKGVYLRQKDGGPVYEVAWSEGGGRIRKTSVSIRKWGKSKAKKMAEEIRRAAVEREAPYKTARN